MTQAESVFFLSITEIRMSLDLGFARLRKHPDILLACFHHAGLALKEI
jgi:hypothetical protein